MNQGSTINLAGVIDKVRANRNNSEVTHLIATVHVEFSKDDGFIGMYGGNVTADLDIPIDVRSGINPGDLVVMTMGVVPPHTQRFVPALEVGNDKAEDLEDEDDDDVLDVMVEQSMIDDSNEDDSGADVDGG